MVRIINFKKRDNDDGTSFFLLELQGGIEMVQSKETGQFYATAKKAFITSTFDEETCKSLIGKEIPGRIVRQEVDPYTYTVKETGQEIILTHRWVYSLESSSSEQSQKPLNTMEELVPDVSAFSQNGVHQLEDELAN